MRKVLPMSRIREMEPYMDAKVLDYIHEGQIEAFEGFEDFDLIAFDWYDVRSERTAASQMLLYLDREDLFVFCEDDAAEDAAQAALLVPEEEALSNEQVLHRFFVRLLREDMAHLDRLEADISDGETEVLTGAHEAYLDRIIAWRQELLRLKRYYEQLDSIFDELAENDNSLLGKQNTRRFANLGNRMERYLNAVQSLRESVAQLREAYQSQLSIQQNDLMKIFTVVTAVFLPLTLLVGWYGMNFVGMPELHWKYGYPAVILVSVGIVAALVIYFKKKKWLSHRKTAGRPHWGAACFVPRSGSGCPGPQISVDVEGQQLRVPLEIQRVVRMAGFQQGAGGEPLGPGGAGVGGKVPHTIHQIPPLLNDVPPGGPQGGGRGQREEIPEGPSVLRMEHRVAGPLHIVGPGGPLGVDVEHQKAVVPVGKRDPLGGLEGGVQGVRRGGGGVDAYADQGLPAPCAQDVPVFRIMVGDVQPPAHIIVRRRPEGSGQGVVKELQRQGGCGALGNVHGSVLLGKSSRNRIARIGGICYNEF